jgi:isopropylmalate/homocitrate/citramalate synthase
MEFQIHDKYEQTNNHEGLQVDRRKSHNQFEHLILSKEDRYTFSQNHKTHLKHKIHRCKNTTMDIIHHLVEYYHTHCDRIKKKSMEINLSID